MPHAAVTTVRPHFSSKSPNEHNGGHMRTTLATTSTVAAGLLLTLLTAAPAAAQGDFRWNGRLAAGQSIEIRGINGDIRATASGSGDVEVTATKQARRGNPDEVRIEVVPHSGGVTICAVYPSSGGREP